MPSRVTAATSLAIAIVTYIATQITCPTYVRVKILQITKQELFHVQPLGRCSVLDLQQGLPRLL